MKCYRPPKARRLSDLESQVLTEAARAILVFPEFVAGRVFNAAPPDKARAEKDVHPPEEESDG